MAIQIGTVDGLINISEDKIRCLVNAINSFSDEGVRYARQNSVTLGTAFQRYVEPVYTGSKQAFDIRDITTPAYTKGGNEQSPARVTFCKKMGLLDIDDRNDIFKLTPLAEELFNHKITIEEYGFVLLTKQGIFKDGQYVENLFDFISRWFENNATISEISLRKGITDKYDDDSVQKTRIDIIINALSMCGLLSSVTNGLYVLSNIKNSAIFNDFIKNARCLSAAIIDDDDDYTDYIGSMSYGIFDILTSKNIALYSEQFPNLANYINNNSRMSNNINFDSFQTIYFGAPGTGKSRAALKQVEGKPHIRTIFHPDSDYASFVGCYKPVMEGEQIKYKYRPQAFVNAYINAWLTDEPYYLVIEEINRGNCAQIFGDIFQLLDRTDGESEYEVHPDTDLQNYIAEEFAKEENQQALADKNGITPDDIVSGKVMRLPQNLNIIATMNTSDQSLFPMDSAFKRRWNWKYFSIKDEGKGFTIKLRDGVNKYDWWKTIEALNEKVLAITKSADKQLGYWFAKLPDGKSVISPEQFVSKVIFYLWNDVFKDYNYGDNNAFTPETTFDKFFDSEGNVVEDTIVKFMERNYPEDETPSE